jgi:hypothetical protein
MSKRRAWQLMVRLSKLRLPIKPKLLREILRYQHCVVRLIGFEFGVVLPPLPANGRRS